MKSPSILLSIVAAVTMTFGVSTSAVQGQCPADLNGDGQINQADVAQLLANSGPVPFPPPVGPPVITPTWATLLEAAPNPAVVTDANLRAAIVASGLAWRVRDNGTNIEMLLVPAGTFTMGCSPSRQYGCASDENPTHQVTLSAFYMGKTEVTQAQWVAKMGSNPSWFVPANAYSSDTTKPVEHVSWDMIQVFNSATSLRLPTEAEWEYAYRAGTTTAFHSYPAQPTGFNEDSILDNIAWYGSNSGSQTHAVGGKLANGLGLHDMSGNVYEWCQDRLGPYSSGSVTNPTGPTDTDISTFGAPAYSGIVRMHRGGAWNSNSGGCMASRRRYFGTGDDDYELIRGFRAARNP